MAHDRIDSAGLVTRLRAETGSPTRVTFTVANPTGAARTFCDYHTPIEGIRNDIFVVVAADTDNEVEYGGMMAKRAAPDDDNYITLAAGEERSAEVDLLDGYDLPPGRYSVRFRGSGICGLPDSAPIDIVISA